PRSRGPGRTAPAGEAGGPGAARPGRAGLSLAGPGAARPPRAYLNGLLSNLLNPKISVFFMAFLPAFIPAGASAAGFSLVLGVWVIAETGLLLAVVALLADRGVRRLRRPAGQR